MHLVLLLSDTRWQLSRITLLLLLLLRLELASGRGGVLRGTVIMYIFRASEFMQQLDGNGLPHCSTIRVRLSVEINHLRM